MARGKVEVKVIKKVRRGLVIHITERRRFWRAKRTDGREGNESVKELDE